MNISISKEYIQKAIGNDSLLQILRIIEMNDALLNYVIPWLGTITILSNFTVIFLCVVIYLKTKRKNHKPAFVFIGFLASIDSLVGGYAKYFDIFKRSEICISVILRFSPPLAL
jgi:hypothetical protein